MEEDKMSEEKVTSKKFQTYLVINWKNKNMRLIKKKPRDLGPFEIPVNIELDIVLPKLEEVQVKGEIEVPAYKAEGIFVGSI